jgi:hypothetical protein
MRCTAVVDAVDFHSGLWFLPPVAALAAAPGVVVDDAAALPPLCRFCCVDADDDSREAPDSALWSRGGAFEGRDAAAAGPVLGRSRVHLWQCWRLLLLSVSHLRQIHCPFDFPSPLPLDAAPEAAEATDGVLSSAARGVGFGGSGATGVGGTPRVAGAGAKREGGSSSVPLWSRARWAPEAALVVTSREASRGDCGGGNTGSLRFGFRAADGDCCSAGWFAAEIEDDVEADAISRGEECLAPDATVLPCANGTCNDNANVLKNTE